MKNILLIVVLFFTIPTYAGEEILTELVDIKGLKFELYQDKSFTGNHRVNYPSGKKKSIVIYKESRKK